MKTYNKYTRHITLLLFVLFAGIAVSVTAQTPPPYQDKAHYSKVFRKEKPYRIYLPDSYFQANKSYPVIYFFHGWGGRHFKDDNAKLEYEKLGEVVNKYQVIMVMWDGNMEESQPRPYNIGYHQDIKYDIQMKDYLPELVSFIDTNYRTISDRDHRGIIGFSMGGILSFYLAGKYPDQFSAAVNMVGSPEFYIGLPNNHTLYQVRYAFDNLRDVALLFHNRDSCQMSGLNDEVNNGALWSQMPHYEYHKMKGSHKVDDPGETKVFESAVKYVCSRFDHPVPLQKTWSHADLCPDFKLWNYTVNSTKDEPGYRILKNVDKAGFGFYTTKWMPIGPAIKDCKAVISTAPLYEPNASYRISHYSKAENKLIMMQMPADKEGRLKFELTGHGTEIGIAKGDQQAGFTVLDYQLNEDQKFIRVGNDNELTLTIFNRDGAFSKKGSLKVTLLCADQSVSFSTPEQTIELNNGKYLIRSKPFKVTTNRTPPTDGSPWFLRLNIKMESNTVEYEDNVVIPIFFDVSYFTDIKVDDGRRIESTNVSNLANSAVSNAVYGTGNGDGTGSAGEQIMLYQQGHRLRLYTDDPYVVASEEKIVDEVLPSVWPDGFTLSSVVKISPDCPAGHEIAFLANYETKSYMPIYREVHWGKVKMKVVAENKKDK